MSRQSTYWQTHEEPAFHVCSECHAAVIDDGNSLYEHMAWHEQQKPPRYTKTPNFGNQPDASS